jgi:serine/threonine protein kinase
MRRGSSSRSNKSSASAPKSKTSSGNTSRMKKSKSNQHKSVLSNKPKVPGYTILGQLGEGAFATVYRAQISPSNSKTVLYNTRSHNQVALKLFENKESIKTGIHEIKTMRRWFDGAGRPRESMPIVTSRRASYSCKTSDEHKDRDYSAHEEDEMGILDLTQHGAAMESICKLLGCFECNTGLALAYELCGATLSSQLWTMKGEFFKGERVYKVTQGVLHRDFFFNDSKLLKILVKTLLEVLLLLDDCGLLHCDIKPDNILIEYDEEHQMFQSIKLIDFGSSVDIQQIVDLNGNISTMHLPTSTTPEYLSPELLHAREGTYGQCGGMTVDDCINPDMWALGSVMLEIVSGFPLWFPYKSRIPREGRKDFWMKGGLLAVGAREPSVICRKQAQIAENVTEALKKCPGRGLSKDAVAMHFLSEMLILDPHERVRPVEHLAHPWLREL